MNFKNNLHFFIIISCLSFFASCKTYYISIESFKQQFQGLDSSNLKEITTQGPLGGQTKYKTTPIDSIFCVDKNGQPVVLTNSPSIEIRFTDNHQKKSIFYFDRITVDSTSVTGVQSRIISSIRKTIPLNTIQKIEVQNGKKKYRYVQ